MTGPSTSSRNRRPAKEPALHSQATHDERIAVEEKERTNMWKGNLEVLKDEEKSRIYTPRAFYTSGPAKVSQGWFVR